MGYRPLYFCDECDKQGKAQISEVVVSTMPVPASSSLGGNADVTGLPAIHAIRPEPRPPQGWLEISVARRLEGEEADAKMICVCSATCAGKQIRAFETESKKAEKEAKKEAEREASEKEES